MKSMGGIVKCFSSEIGHQTDPDILISMQPIKKFSIVCKSKPNSKSVDLLTQLAKSMRETARSLESIGDDVSDDVVPDLRRILKSINQYVTEKQ